jgi:hypothetical protein
MQSQCRRHTIIGFPRSNRQPGPHHPRAATQEYILHLTRNRCLGPLPRSRPEISCHGNRRGHKIPPSTVRGFAQRLPLAEPWSWRGGRDVGGYGQGFARAFPGSLSNSYMFRNKVRINSYRRESLISNHMRCSYSLFNL